MSLAPSHAPGTLISGRKTVADAGTPEAISSSSTLCYHVDVMALNTNTNPITIGAQGVDHGTQSGVRLAAGDSWTGYDFDLSSLWIDVQTNGEGVAWIAVKRG